ncbi:MAG: DUF1553 domain-containing protein [Planctomycetaceae bacterium]|nr:DUF1553 domain-containing protein [Planctomycetaceae bacterium]
MISSAASFRISLLCVVAALPVVNQTAAEEQVQFNRDIRPILSDNCFFCHGPDANHRQADLRLDLREEAIAANAFVPGKPGEGTLLERIMSDDPEQIMPPPDSHKKLTPAQKKTLQQWIAQGAEYQQHWSFEPPVKAEIPAGENGIDFLVQQRLQELGLKPSPEADRRTLVRRLYNDLIGLPPTPEQVNAFINDGSEDAYEKLVDSLLANPHYGERMGQWWLDLVRFADTIGYHSDNPRNVWPYRDYVIESFNENKPFDQFTIEQIAGDLLPEANQETRVGSGFNRLLLSTEEGGAQPKDYEARMLTDRVRAVGTVWLGMTTGCCQCHDHKFDPFTMRDFYSLGAFFADIQEPILGKREAGMLVITAEQEAELARRDAELKAAQKLANEAGAVLDKAQAEWEASLPSEGLSLPELAEDSKASKNEKDLAKAALDALSKPADQRDQKLKSAIQEYYRAVVNREHQETFAALKKAEQEKTGYENSLPHCIVSISTNNKRTVRILPRGNWMDESGEVMQPALPHFLPQPEFGERELTRLDLANWLVSRDNPLTARAYMNRLWKQFFGTGLSKVLDDLGAQGETPPNAPLLDWLACELMDSGWDVKHMVRLIVTSKTYQQTSVATPALLAADPYNREHARQSAFRMDAELVRDYALSVSGLLVLNIGGPSVKPYQPGGYWENLNFPRREYDADKGESQYRRGLYTWWQRTFLHPSLMAFDAPSREECCAERNRSNIPQQALVLLNDPTYVEAARKFAERILTEGPKSTEERLRWAWQQALQRDPDAEELKVIEPLLAQHLQVYREDPQAAESLLKTGLAPRNTELDPVELAAWSHVARVLLNLHETITRS